ncbi:hypothetical protein M3172_19575 [Mesobacillus subterraneus]|uniref:hypothetical protein n=1 Tax=Mesobacillus subterraneus TaxID=285983 RepID=UPI00203BE201|nr:hypothetical protein [Mesobacillus subterraneus]MCM3575405.1 hypothetical protein [Mesobacillus subterraneus]
MIQKLTHENFQKARSYLMTYGRDLEQELFRFHFENGDPVKVISILKQYQGENGGFKNMGEGHSAIPNSMDTSMAFQYLSEVAATTKEDVVQKGIKYIIDTYDSERECWHARPDQQSSGWSDNPCAELAGFLYEFRELVPQYFIKDVTDTAQASMSTIHTSKEERQFYFLEALSLLRLAIRIDEPFKSIILAQLNKDILEIIETDSSKWTTTYCAKPFFFANSPESPLFLPIKEYVIRSLENEINSQAEDGHFILNWNADEEGAILWKSIWTMDVLKALKNHELIDFQ